jgi:hypothetical protein
MIRLIPGQSQGSAGRSGQVFAAGRILSLKVLGGTEGRFTILADGKKFSVSSAIPLKKGDILIVRALQSSQGLELKLLEQVDALKTSSYPGLDQLLRQEPELVRALIRAGLPLKEENMRRFRKALGDKEGKEREEHARFLSLLDQKGLFLLHRSWEGSGYDGRHEDRDEKSGREQWQSEELSPQGMSRLINRRSNEASSLSLFNHTSESSDSHWMLIPLKISLGGSSYAGEIRLHLSRRQRRIREGTVILKSMAGSGEEWVFGLTESEGRSVYPVRLPAAGEAKIADFTEKVRKLGFSLVDTVNRGLFDGYSIHEPPVSRGIDAQV